METSTKLCSKCEQTLPITDYVKRKDAKDGLSYHCKSCVRAYKDSRKESLRVYQRAYQQENKGRLARKAREEYQQGGRRKTYAKEYNQTPRGKFSTYKTAAKARDLPFDTTFEAFTTFWQKPCTYCGDPIDTIGIDRVDSDKGYEFGNLVPCCTDCNLMKRHHSYDKFINKIKQVLEHQKK